MPIPDLPAAPPILEPAPISQGAAGVWRAFDPDILGTQLKVNGAWSTVVGVAPAEVDEEFDFEEAMRDIHLELADLNHEATALAMKIQENFEELGV